MPSISPYGSIWPTALRPGETPVAERWFDHRRVFRHVATILRQILDAVEPLQPELPLSFGDFTSIKQKLSATYAIQSAMCQTGTELLEEMGIPFTVNDDLASPRGKIGILNQF